MCTTITEDPHLREDHQIEIIQHHRHLISCRHLSLKQQPQLLLLQCSNQARPSEYSISIEQYWVWPKKTWYQIMFQFHEFFMNFYSQNLAMCLKMKRSNICMYRFHEFFFVIFFRKWVPPSALRREEPSSRRTPPQSSSRSSQKYENHVNHDLQRSTPPTNGNGHRVQHEYVDAHSDNIFRKVNIEIDDKEILQIILIEFKMVEISTA